MKLEKLRIRALRARAVAVPMKRPLATATGAVTIAPLLLLDLETDSGITGRSYLFGIGQPHLRPMAALVEVMADMIKGDSLAPFEIERKLRAKFTLLGVHNIVLFSMSGIDMAAWDALGQALGQPLVRLLGGRPRPVSAYNSKGLGIQPLKPLLKEAETLVGEGFSAVKLRLGRARAEDDIEALRAVKKAIGPKVTLMTDFNQGLSVAEAIRRGRMIDEVGGVTWIEEPVRADDFAGNACGNRGIRIGGDGRGCGIGCVDVRAIRLRGFDRHRCCREDSVGVVYAGLANAAARNQGSAGQRGSKYESGNRFLGFHGFEFYLV